jgi:hypothetical protein
MPGQYISSRVLPFNFSDSRKIEAALLPMIEDVVSWGGEDNVPVFYGKVFSAVKPKSFSYLSNNIKEQMKTVMKNKYNIVSITPEIVDADYIDVIIASYD